MELKECHFFGITFSFDKFGTTYFLFDAKLLTYDEDGRVFAHKS